MILKMIDITLLIKRIKKYTNVQSVKVLVQLKQKGKMENKYIVVLILLYVTRKYFRFDLT